MSVPRKVGDNVKDLLRWGKSKQVFNGSKECHQVRVWKITNNFARRYGHKFKILLLCEMTRNEEAFVFSAIEDRRSRMVIRFRKGDETTTMQ